MKKKIINKLKKGRRTHFKHSFSSTTVFCGWSSAKSLSFLSVFVSSFTCWSPFFFVSSAGFFSSTLTSMASLQFSHQFLDEKKKKNTVIEIFASDDTKLNSCEYKWREVTWCLRRNLRIHNLPNTLQWSKTLKQHYQIIQRKERKYREEPSRMCGHLHVVISQGRLYKCSSLHCRD